MSSITSIQCRFNHHFFFRGDSAAIPDLVDFINLNRPQCQLFSYSLSLPFPTLPCNSSPASHSSTLHTFSGDLSRVTEFQADFNIAYRIRCTLPNNTCFTHVTNGRCPICYTFLHSASATLGHLKTCHPRFAFRLTVCDYTSATFYFITIGFFL